MFCGSLNGRGVWGRMDISICMPESLRCLPKLSQHCFLINYIPIQEEKKKKRPTHCMVTVSISIFNACVT